MSKEYQHYLTKNWRGGPQPQRDLKPLGWAQLPPVEINGDNALPHPQLMCRNPTHDVPGASDCPWVIGLAPSCTGHPRKLPHLSLLWKHSENIPLISQEAGPHRECVSTLTLSLENKLLISQGDDISDELRHQGNASLWWHPHQLSPLWFKLLPPLQRWLRDLGNHVHPKQHLRLYLLETQSETFGARPEPRNRLKSQLWREATLHLLCSN